MYYGKSTHWFFYHFVENWLNYVQRKLPNTWALQHGLVQVDIQNQDKYIKQKSFSILILCRIICPFWINGRQVSF